MIDSRALPTSCVAVRAVEVNFARPAYNGTTAYVLFARVTCGLHASTLGDPVSASPVVSPMGSTVRDCIGCAGFGGYKAADVNQPTTRVSYTRLSLFFLLLLCSADILRAKRRRGNMVKGKGASKQCARTNGGLSQQLIESKASR